MLIQKIRELKSKKLVIIGIGNDLHGDDGFGPVMIKKLEGRIDQKLIDCGVSPENFTSEIIKEKPDGIIFLDAANFEGNAGDIKIIKGKEIPKAALSTHSLPLSILMDYLNGNTGAEIFMIGVKPECLVEMSEEVKNTIERLSDLFIREFS